MHGIAEFEKYLADSKVRYKENGAEFIYSLVHVKEFLLRLISELNVRSICEIGSQGGLFSQELARLYREGVLERLTIVDPVPAPQVRAMDDGRGCTVKAGLSLDVLGDLPAHDLYIVDGDHNYYTVKNELKLIFKHPEAVAIMHDIGWPCATRDMYYTPHTIPESARHAHTFEVVLDPAVDGISEAGEMSRGSYAVALKDGGPENGVFPALRDVSAELNLQLDSLPALLGLGVVRRVNHPGSAAIENLFPSPEIDALLWRLEENRISNWIAKEHADHRLRAKDAQLTQLQETLMGDIAITDLVKLLAKAIRRRLFGC